MEAYFGYPITPQTELLEYLSWRMPELGRVFVQSESELAAINMVYGAACAGARAMTSSSSPGISLMQEGLSYIAGTQVPCVLVDMMRGGPGLGNIAPSQGDYFQLTKGGGHGDYHPIVLAPSSVQEAVDLTYLAFDLAEKYRTIVIIAADGNIGQMMEPVEMPPMRELAEFTSLSGHDRGWELSGAQGRDKRILTSIYLQPEDLQAANTRIQETEAAIEDHETRYESRWIEDIPEGDPVDLLVVAFGSAARVAQSAVREARSRGLRAGLFRPISLWPFPSASLKWAASHACDILVVEMNSGQMVEDVQLAVGPHKRIDFLGTTGGVVPMPDEILARIEGTFASAYYQEVAGVV
jgi:2-oxoglutarate ferredoxin oxidoreductase subunit alpha